jgi:hypothetical protein
MNLSLRAIWETACTLDELLVWDTEMAGASAEHLQMLNAKLANSRYGGPWMYACDRIAALTPRMFQLMAFLAADPPLPFLGSPDPVVWSDIYPPLRFAHLCNALGANSAVATKLASASVGAEEGLDLLSEISGLRSADWPVAGQLSSVSLITNGGLVRLNRDELRFDRFPHLKQSSAGSLNAMVRASLLTRSTYATIPDAYVWPQHLQSFAVTHETPSWANDGSQAAGLMVPLVQYLEDSIYLAGIGADGVAPFLLSPSEVSDYCNSVFTRTAMTSFLSGWPFAIDSLPPVLRRPSAVAEYAELLTSSEIEPTAW